MDVPLKFKVFNRHLNQRSPTLLGFGSIHINEVSETETMSTTQKLAVINKGIKMGELKVNIELGCDRIHFGRDFVGESKALFSHLFLFLSTYHNTRIYSIQQMR